MYLKGQIVIEIPDKMIEGMNEDIEAEISSMRRKKMWAKTPEEELRKVCTARVMEHMLRKPEWYNCSILQLDNQGITEDEPF